jgi:hypothetical protein
MTETMPTFQHPLWTELFEKTTLAAAPADHARLLFIELTRCHKLTGSGLELIDIFSSLVDYYNSVGFVCSSDDDGLTVCELAIGTGGGPIFLWVVLNKRTEWDDDEFRTRCGVFVEVGEGAVSVQYRYDKFAAAGDSTAS